MKTSTVVLSSTLFLIGNAISVFLVYPINKNLGLTWSIRIGLLFNIVGSLLRIFVNHNFNWVIFGQFLMGVSSCFVYNNQMEFNYNWFHPRNRPIFNSILTLSVYIGGGLGNSVPLIFMNTSSIGSSNEAHYEVYHYSLKMFYFVLALSVVTLLVFRGEPPTGYG
jgi:cyanate permease